MKIKSCIAAIVLTAGTAVASFAQMPFNWKINNGAKANFSIDGLMGVDVNGTLQFKVANITFDPQHPESSKMYATLAVSTIATGIGKRDSHLKSDDFFDASKYPDITFQSSKIEKTGAGYRMTGNLKIKSVSKAVVIPFTFNQNGGGGEFKGNFNINRVDYQIGTGKENGMGKEVRIKLTIPVKKA